VYIVDKDIIDSRAHQHKPRKLSHTVRKHGIPVPMPVTTFWSVPPIIPADTTDGVIGPCGAILGRYMHPKPSQLISNSTNDGVMAAPWRRMSRGVVMETRHFTRVSNTGPPFTGVNDALGLDTLLTTVSVDVVFKLFPVTTSTGDGDVSAFDNNEDDDETGCNLSIVPANVRPVSMSASRLASCCCSSLSAAQNNGAPSRRKSLPTASQFHTNTVRQTDIDCNVLQLFGHMCKIKDSTL